MQQKLFSLAFGILAFFGAAYYLTEYQAVDPEIVWPIAGVVFAFWFLFWFAWAFRWVVVVAPITIGYILFAFYGMDGSVVGIGGVVSIVLFVLTGIQQHFANRKTRAADKQARKQYDQLKRKFGE